MMNRMWVGLLGLVLVGAALGQLSQSAIPSSVVTCDSSVALQMNSVATTQAVAMAAGKSVYVCGFVFNADGKVEARLVQGSGSNCGTGQSDLTPPFSLAAGGNVALGGGVGRLVKSNAGSAVCVASSTNKTLNVLVIYTQF